MGVLSFLNLINSVLAPAKISLKGDVSQGYKVAYQMICMPDGVVLVPPPLKQLNLLISKVGQQSNQMALIMNQRADIREDLSQHLQELETMAMKPKEKVLMPFLEDMSHINQLARRNGVFYEEFILFGIFPGGGSVYHQIRNILLEHPKLTISVGMEPLNKGWQLMMSAN